MFFCQRNILYVKRSHLYVFYVFYVKDITQIALTLHPDVGHIHLIIMLERDYIMRLVREFAEALELLLGKKDIDVQREEMRRMYGRYVGPYEFYHTAAIEDVMESFGQFPEGERLSRMEMLAELYYAETGMVSGPARDMLLNKALAMFSFIDSHDRTYSISRISKMADIRRRLTETI